MTEDRTLTHAKTRAIIAGVKRFCPARALLVAASLLLAGIAPARAGDCDPFAVSVATDPVPYQYPHGLRKARALLDDRPAKVDTMLLGDSLAANWPHDMAQRQFGSDHVWNFAVGGALTQNTLWQLGHIDVAAVQPRTIVVIVGTNNLTHDYMPACAVAAGIKAVAVAAHAKWPKAAIQVMTIAPRGRNFQFRDAARLAVNAELADWSSKVDGINVFAVDDRTLTCGRYDRDIEIAAKGDSAMVSRCANYADDFGHFKRPGYDVIFSALSR